MDTPLTSPNKEKKHAKHRIAKHQARLIANACEALSGRSGMGVAGSNSGLPL